MLGDVVQAVGGLMGLIHMLNREDLVGFVQLGWMFERRQCSLVSLLNYVSLWRLKIHLS